jgi:predicted Zn-dependent peptidase
MLMALESTSSTAEVAARQTLLYNRIVPIDEIVGRVDAVTLEDVQNAARFVFSSKPTYTLLGDLKSYPTYEKIQKYLKF